MSVLNTILSRILLFALKQYQRIFRPWLGLRCRFYPSCSAYAQQALLQRGLWVGLRLLFRRLLRCHPWNPGGFDPVPESPCHPKILK